MGLITREAILGADDIKYEDVEVPEWGGTVRVKVMTVAERNRFRDLPRDEDNGAWMFSNLVVGEDGKPVLSKEDAESLGARSWIAYDRVIAAILRVNGMDGKRIDDALKN